MVALRKDTFLYGGAVLLDRLLSFVMLPLLTRWMPAQDFGAWTQTMVAAGLLVPLVVFALPTAVVRYYAASAFAGARSHAFVRWGRLPLLLGTVCGLLLLLGDVHVARLVYGDTAHRDLVQPLILCLLAESLSEYALAWMRASGRMGWISAYTLLRSCLRYGLVAGLLLFSPPTLMTWLLPYAGVQVLVCISALLYVGWQLRRDARTATQPAAPVLPEWRGVLDLCAPLVLLSFLTALSSFADRFVLVQVLSLDQVATYSAVASLCGVSAVFYSVLGFTLFPQLSRQWHEGKQAAAAVLVARSVQIFAFLSLPLALLTAVAGPQLLPLLTTKDYLAPWMVFALLSLAVCAFGIYQVVLYPLLLAGRSAQVLRLALIAAVLSVLGNAVLTPSWGLQGAALAAGLSTLSLAALAARASLQVLAWRFPWPAIGRCAALAGLAGLACTAALELLAKTLSGTCLAMAIGGLIYLGGDLLTPNSLVRRLLRP